MSSETSTDQSLQPWQFFVLAALGCATAVTFIVRGEGLTPVVLLTVVMGTVALVGLAVLRTVRPLVGESHDRTVMIGERTRVALEREKTLTLRALKELEFDHQMKKVVDEDFREMTARLRARAIRIMKQLDEAGGYRQRIEQDVAARLAARVATPGRSSEASGATERASSPARAVPPATGGRACAGCQTPNDVDARFCKSCGQPL
jgi:cell division septation protein DedD